MSPSLPHILVVEDDAEIGALIARYLQAQQFRVSVVADGRGMDDLLAEHRVDLIILDLMLPGEDGLSLCRRLRSSLAVPIIMLTARGEDIDRIIGLEMGADDYLAKPFNPRELLARIKAVLRRGDCADSLPRPSCSKLFFADWQVDCALRQLHDSTGVRISLTGAEFDLLQAFCDNAGRLLTRDQLLNLTHGRATGPFDRSIDVLVSRLRQKIERNARKPELIQTIRSGGYLFSARVGRQ
jgi:two-component system, OmpR family, response regulator